MNIRITQCSILPAINIHINRHKIYKTMKPTSFLPVLGLLLLISVSGCSKENETSTNAIALNTRLMRAEEATLVVSANQFSFDYFKKLSNTEPAQNIAFSPFSAHTALSMLINGADGTTRQEIKEALRIPAQSDSSVNSSFKSLKNYLYTVDPTVNIKIANSVWWRKELHVKSAFAETLKNYYDAELNPLDFAAAQSVQTINNWVNTQTSGRIPTILNSLAPEDVMVLLNAVWFKAAWTEKFDKSLTAKKPFTLDDGTIIQVDMMKNSKTNARIYSDNEVDFADIPFAGDAYSFSVAMPADSRTLDEFVSTLSEEKFNRWTGYAAKSSSRTLQMPRFKFAYEHSMNDLLKEMGMKRAFGADAELGRLFDETLDLFVSKVKQKTFVQIDEEGGEAAAVTSIVVGVTSAGPGYFDVDRPFLFVIREKTSKTILFIGKVHRPVY